MVRVLRIASVLLGVLAVSVPVSAAEGFTLFWTDVALLDDGAVSVAEVMDVVAEGKQIKHGVFRELPLVRSGRGGWWSVSYEILGAERDGRPEP